MSVIAHVSHVCARNDFRGRTAVGTVFVSAALLCLGGAAQAQVLNLGGGTQALNTLVDPVTSTDYALVSNGLLQLTTATNQTFTGVFDDSLGVFTFEKLGPGVLTLTSTSNAYSGGTTISGGSIAFAAGNAFGTGPVTLSAGTGISATATGLTVANAISTTGNAVIDSGAGTLTLSGPITGAGSITKTGAGTLVLSGANNFANAGINQGTLSIASNTALGGTGGLSMSGNSTLQAGVAGLVLINPISTADASRIDTNCQTLTLNVAMIGPGSFTKTGAGTLVLNGANSFGNAAIDTGTLVIGSNTALGAGGLSMGDGTTLQAGAANLVVANPISSAGAAIIDTNGNTLTLGGSLLGPGSFTKINAGTLVLNGANSFTNFGLLGGTLVVGSSTALGGPASGLTMAGGTTLVAGASAALVNPITTVGAGIIDTGANTLTLSGNINGAGSLTKIGTGTLVLSGNNSFDNVGVFAGTLGVGSNTAAGLNGISMASGTTLQAAANGLTLANAISTQGTLNIDTNGNNLKLGGAIVGPGSITKTGAGTLTLTSSGSTFAGTTTVAAGQLDVNGVYNSAVTVQSGATIGGTGVLGSVALNSGSTIAPGAAAGQVGTLTIGTSLAIPAGSTFAVDVIGTQADRLNVGGTATLGGTLAANVSNASFNTPYTVLTANSVTGTFGTLTQTPSGTALVPVVSYTPTSVNLTITPGSLVNYLGGAGTVNQTNTAAALTAATVAGFNPQNFYGLYVGGGGSALGTQLNQLTGELRSGERRTAISDTRYAREAALARLGPDVCTPNQVNASTTVTTEMCSERFAVWGGVVGAWGDYNGDGNGSHSTTHTEGVMAGGEMKYGPFKVGAFFNQTITHLDYILLGGSSVKSIGGTGYIGWRPGSGLAVAAGGGYSQTDYRSSRNITVPGLQQTLRSSGGGDIWQLFGDIAYDVSWSPAYSAEPFARIAYVQSNTDPVSETGGYAAINTLDQNYDTTFLTVGLRGAAHFGANNAGSFSASAGWQHIWGDAVPTVSNALFGTSPTAGGLNYAQIQTVPMDDNAAAVEVAFKYRVGGMADVGIGYSGILGNRYIDNALFATIGVGF